MELSQPWTDERLADLLKSRAQYGSAEGTARALGMTERNCRRLLARAREAAQKAKPFEATELPSELPTAEELLARRSKQFDKKREAEEARALIPIAINIDGPIGIMHMGDPHIDDDGTDVRLLKRHVDVVNATEGMFAGNVGDASNNWVGRLARLYAQQSTSAAEAWVLVEWLVHATKWIYLVGGNHDVWSGDGDPIKWMAKMARIQYEHHGARLGLTFPNKRVIRVNARHDWKGHSMWHTTHGPVKAATMGWRDHVLTCGHLHISGYEPVRDPSSGLISHALRVGSYKTYDRFAKQLGLPNQTFSVAPVTIIDPEQPDDSVRCVTVILDPEEGAEFLKFKRQQWKRKRA